MNKILKHILFNTVLYVIVLHTIIPHPHSDELTTEQHIELHNKSNSLFGIIRLLFHENNDEGLDNLIFAQYKDNKKINFRRNNPKVSVFANTTSKFEKITTTNVIKYNTNNFKNILFIKLNRLRGPPFFI